VILKFIRVSLPNECVACSLVKFSCLFLKQFTTNKVKPPIMTTLFHVRQHENEPLKHYMTYFCNFNMHSSIECEDVVKFHTCIPLTNLSFMKVESMQK